MAQTLLLVLGTRPEAVKLGMVARALRRRRGLSTRVCVTGQHRDLVDPVLATVGVAIDHRGRAHTAAPELTAQLAHVITHVAEVIRAESPQWVVVQGDTTSALGGALAAVQSGVPVAHVEAGLRTGTLHAPWPEEAYRRMITPLAQLHFAPTTRAADTLRREGVPDRRVVMTGNPGIDALVEVIERLDSDEPTQRTLEDRFDWLGEGRWVLVTAHRRENQGAPLAALCRGLREVLARRPDVGVVWPVHPSPRVRGPVVAELGGVDPSRLRLLDALDHVAFVHLLRNTALVVTDSGGVQEEAPWVGCPALVMRSCTERPEAVEAGSSRLVSPEDVAPQVLRLLDDPAHYATMSTPRALFGDGHAAERIAAVLDQEVRGRVPARPHAG